MKLAAPFGLMSFTAKGFVSLYGAAVIGRSITIPVL
jgi:hypothetical protein